uniref:Uncharacterized protein n=1 Tax=Schlesneria paludicola TaxID=360056 RepID=A0A7C4QNT5_9PLAN
MPSTALMPRIVTVFMLLLAGCATHLDRVAPVREAFFAGDLASAQAAVDAQLRKHRGDQDVLKLDQAMVELAAGRPQSAERLLREVRDRFDHLEQRNLAEDAASLAADDTVRAYPGEDYEKVLIRALLALANLMAGGEDAAAYALQIADKQAQIAARRETEHLDERLYRQAYQQVALGPYIRAMIAEESPLTLDDAVRARVQVASWAPEFRDAQADLQRAQYEVPIPPGQGVLYVFALVGRGPVKEEVHEVATQAALLVADRIVTAVSPRGLPPTLAPVPIPKVVTRTPVAEAIAVQVDEHLVGQTATLVDIGSMAALQQQARYPEIVGRAVARRVLKKGAIYAVKEGVQAAPYSPASLALNAVGIAWEATERADLRCWSLLPDQIQVLRTTLPAGEHELRLAARTRHGQLGAPASTRVRIHEGRNTYVLCQFPDSRLVGQILTSSGAP